MYRPWLWFSAIAGYIMSLTLQHLCRIHLFCQWNVLVNSFVGVAACNILRASPVFSILPFWAALSRSGDVVKKASLNGKRRYFAFSIQRPRPNYSFKLWREIELRINRTLKVLPQQEWISRVETNGSCLFYVFPFPFIYSSGKKLIL